MSASQRWRRCFSAWRACGWGTAEPTLLTAALASPPPSAHLAARLKRICAAVFSVAAGSRPVFMCSKAATCLRVLATGKEEAKRPLLMGAHSFD